MSEARVTASARLEARRAYLRPLQVSIALAILGELGVFFVFGVILFPGGSLVGKLLWAVLFCGVGMGASAGAFVDLLVVGRWHGARAIVATTAIFVLLLGVACNVLCWQLDRGFHYFGGAERPLLFLLGGLFWAALGGGVAGALLFTERGGRILGRLGL